jgi:hypothetical protein
VLFSGDGGSFLGMTDEVMSIELSCDICSSSCILYSLEIIEFSINDESSLESDLKGKFSSVFFFSSLKTFMVTLDGVNSTFLSLF